MIYAVTINNTEYEVEVEVGRASIVNTTALTYTQPQAAIVAPLAQAAAQTTPVANTSVPSPEGAVPVNSPMPGTILDVKVVVGTSVKKGDVLLILEAMKMENEITAVHDGTVVQIAVQKGAAVSTGDLLLSIK